MSPLHSCIIVGLVQTHDRITGCLSRADPNIRRRLFNQAVRTLYFLHLAFPEASFELHLRPISCKFEATFGKDARGQAHNGTVLELLPSRGTSFAPLDSPSPRHNLCYCDPQLNDMQVRCFISEPWRLVIGHPILCVCNMAPGKL